MTTGLYPQSLIISFPQTVEIRSVKLSGSGSNILIPILLIRKILNLNFNLSETFNR